MIEAERLNKFDKSKIIIIGSICIAISLTFPLTSCSLFPKEAAVMAPPLKEPVRVSYDTVDVRKGTIEKKVTCTGSFISVSQKDLYFTYRGGYLRNIYVKSGDKVKPGDVVADLDTENLESSIKQQELSLVKTQMVYNKLESDSANGNIPPDINLLRLQLIELQRQDIPAINAEYGVKIKDVPPGLDVENLRSQIEQKKLLLKKAEDQYKRDLELARLNVEIEILRLNDQKKELERSKLTSSIEGEVVFVDNKLTSGSFINAYKILVRVADPTQLQIQYSADTKISDFPLGVKVDLKIDNKAYSGEVVMTPANAPLDADETLKKSIRIKAYDIPAGVGIGTSANISITQEKKENVIIIPRNAIKLYNGRKYVQILEDGIKKERDIETGLETATETEVVKGIKEGDKLIIG